MTKKKVKIVVCQTVNSKLQQNDITYVSNGYARNYLLPKQIAYIATNKILDNTYKKQKILNQKSYIEHQKNTSIHDILNHTYKFSLKRKVSSDYRFFGSIMPLTIIQIIFNSTGIVIDKKQINLIPMRKVGVYNITINVSSNVTTNIKVQVLPVYN